MANMLFDTLFGRYAGQDSPFLHLADGRTITHQAFLAQAAGFAHVFTQLGVGPGDRLAVQIEKSPEALAVYAACVQAGIIFLPLNTAYTADEVTYFVENSGAKILICDGRKHDALATGCQGRRRNPSDARCRWQRLSCRQGGRPARQL